MQYYYCYNNIIGVNSLYKTARKSAPNSRSPSVQLGRTRNSIPTPLTASIGETDSHEELKYSKKISGFHRSKLNNWHESFWSRSFRSWRPELSLVNVIKILFILADSPVETTIEVTKLEPVSSKRRDETEKEIERRRNEVSSFIRLLSMVWYNYK